MDASNLKQRGQSRLPSGGKMLWTSSALTSGSQDSADIPWASSRNPYQCSPFSMMANSDAFCITRSSGWGSSHDALGVAHLGIIKPCVDAHRAPPARAAQGFAAAGTPTVPTCTCLWGGGHWMSVFGLCDSSSLSSVACVRSEWPCFSCRLGWAELARSGCAPRAACYRTAAGLCADTCKASVSASS